MTFPVLCVSLPDFSSLFKLPRLSIFKLWESWITETELCNIVVSDFDAKKSARCWPCLSF